MKRLRAALKEKSNWPSLVTLALILICSVFSFWDTKFSEQARSAAFALVAVEFFIMLVVHLEEVKGAVREMKNGETDGTLKSRRKVQQMGSIIAEAKEELFFCGWALSKQASFQQELLGASDKVHIRLLVLDLNDENARNRCADTFGRTPILPSMEHLKWLSSKNNVKIRTVKSPVPMHISARDMRMNTGFIQVLFPRYGEVGADSDPCVDLYSAKSDWYDHFKDQIELLWAQGTPWNPQGQ